MYVSEELEKDVEFEVVGEVPEKGPAPAAEDGKSIANGNKDSAQPSTSSKGTCVCVCVCVCVNVCIYAVTMCICKC